jgi:hypothetical protein
MSHTISTSLRVGGFVFIPLPNAKRDALFLCNGHRCYKALYDNSLKRTARPEGDGHTGKNPFKMKGSFIKMKK